MARKNAPNNSKGNKFKKKCKGKDWKNRKSEEDEGKFEEVGLDEAETRAKPLDEVDDFEDSDGECKETRRLVQQQNRKKKKSGGFQSMGLSHAVYTGLMHKGYKVPTPIQRKTIPLILDGKDVVAMARTGSGKTAAFLLPMFEKLKTHNAKQGARALVLSPTRELALQTLKFTKELGKYTALRAAVILGGDSLEDQFAALHENPDVIIATPGRLVHVAVEMDLKLQDVQYVVFDEADRLFEMGFQEQLQEILGRLPESRQTLLFSATLPRLLVDFARAGLHDPTLIRLDIDAKLSQQLKMSFLQCRSEDKTAVLLHLLQNVVKPSEQTVVFVATKHHVEYFKLILQEAGISCSYTYSALDQTARKINVAKFRNRKTMVLVVTDLAARGIDIPLLDNVINFNFPAKPKLFVHRVGRVARAGQSGTAYSLISPDELAFVIDLHLFLGRSLKIAKPHRHGESKTHNYDDGLFGQVSQTVIDEESHNLTTWHEKIDISNMKRVITNAYKQYSKSRPAPSSESIKRAKRLADEQIGIHPLFSKSHDDLVESGRHQMLESMKNYKPQTTIFEINSTKKMAAFSVMKRKREMHNKIVASNVKRLADLRSKFEAMETEERTPVSEMSTDLDLESAFSRVVSPTLNLHPELTKKKKKRKHEVVDSENYLQYRPKDFQSEKGLSLGSSFERDAAGAMLDLTGDEDVNQRRMQGSMRWDRKKKKFVRDTGADGPNAKKIRTESGALIPATYKKNIYKDWLEKNKLGQRQAANDSDDDDGNQKPWQHARKQQPNKLRLQVVGGGRQRGRGFHAKRGDSAPPGGKKGTPGKVDTPRKGRGQREVKTKEQILKERRKTSKQRSFQMNKNKKHSQNKARKR